jgi:lathosterol oxidase
MTTARRSILAYASAFLGLSAVVGVLCFHFPELLTSRISARSTPRSFARHLLLAGLIAAFTIGTVRDPARAQPARGDARRRQRHVAVVLGGTNVHFDAIGQTPYSLGLDWFVISLFFSALVFVRWKNAPGSADVAAAPGVAHRPGLLLHGHVLVQFILILVTASTSGRSPRWPRSRR